MSKRTTATSTVPAAGKMASLPVALACAVVAVLANGSATTSAEKDVPEWASGKAMQLTLSTSAGDWLPLQCTVIPLTENVGLNESGRVGWGGRVCPCSPIWQLLIADARFKIIQIDGKMIAADSPNSKKIISQNDVAYLSCDNSNDAFLDPDEMLKHLM